MALEPDLLDPSSRADPYPAYRALREGAPVHWNGRLGMWVVTRYEDVAHVLTNSTGFTVERFADGRVRRDATDAASVLREWLVYRDPPAHTRLRALMAHSFTPRRIEAMRPRVRRLVEHLLDDAAARGTTDFIATVAFPLPATVVAGLLGVPDAELERVKVWSNQIAALIGGARSGSDAEQAGTGLLAARDYFRALVRERRLEGSADDVLATLLAAEDGGGRLSEDELVANAILLVFAGHETTTNLLGNGLYHLLHHPAQEAALRARPDLLPSAVEEFLRYDAPVAGTLRIATADTELRGQTIRSGQIVAGMLAAANRDPARFEQPDRLDVARTPNRHLSFGHAIHFCLGAGLARLEAQELFAALLRRFGRIELLDQAPRWKSQLFFRELHGLNVALS
jgi:cytochrome P450